MNTFFIGTVDEYGDTTYSFTTAGYTLFVLFLIAAVLIACFFTNKDNRQKFSTRQLVVSSMAIALAFVTSCIKIIDLPQGGSVTLFSMFFICFVGYLYGPRSGIMAGVAYGLLQMLIDPYIISVPQMMLDYIFAFGALGLAGFMSGKKHGMLAGYTIGILGRLLFSVLSGVIFFGMYAPAGTNVWVYSLSYNGFYILLEGAITALVLAYPAVRKGLARVRIIVNEDDAKRIQTGNGMEKIA